MLKIIEANGTILETDMTIADFQALVANAAPSSWITITETHYGDIYLNTFTVAFYYEV